MIQQVTQVKFGSAFAKPENVRSHSGNDEFYISCSKNALELGAGHSFNQIA